MAATIAAGVAVRVGLAIARTQSERRSAERRTAEHALGLRPREGAAEGIRRMMLAQADLAIEALRSARSEEQTERAVHETRKAIKRMRALLRLTRGWLEVDIYEREHALLVELAHELAGARDAAVMLETLSGLIARHPKRLKGLSGVTRLARALQAERERTHEELLLDIAGRQRAIDRLSAFRARVGRWSTATPDRIFDFEARRIYDLGKRRYRRAKRGSRPHAKRLHEWRKRAKDLRYTAEALGTVEIDGKPSGGLSDTAARGQRLSELLGEEHDLAVLAAWIEGRGPKGAARRPKPGHRAGKELLRLIAKRRGKLRRQALREGKRLYSLSGKKFEHRMNTVRRRRYKLSRRF